MARVIEEKILDVFFNGVSGKSYNLSKRDRVIVREDSTSYYLWSTELVRKDKQGNIYIFPSSSTSEEDNYYHGYYWRDNYPPITNTTRSRLNAFIWELLKTGGFSQKNWELYFGDKKIETDSWYKLDRENKKLVEVSIDD